jgi:DNA modification methylase
MDLKQKITNQYALYNTDCIETMKQFPENSIHLSVYSPPFASMYSYSSSDYDLGNNKSYSEFLEHYEFAIKEIQRITMSGRLTVVHCMDIPVANNGLIDLPGDIIRLHQKNGFYFHDRKAIWKEPLRVAIRTRSRALMHQQLCKEASICRSALADYILVFRKKGENIIPIKHEYGLEEFIGELRNEADQKEYQYLLNHYKKHKDQQTNKLSQFIWRRYASSIWDDVRQNRMIDYKCARERDDERHVCPLLLDIIERCIILWSNENETVLTPFMGVGSEVYGAIIQNRKAIGIELKTSYYNQAEKNVNLGINVKAENKPELFTEFEELETEVDLEFNQEIDNGF